MTVRKSPGRQRSPESRDAILTSTFELLMEKPLRDISIEEIARKAGVGKVTIYRWWPTKAYVALDAYRRVLDRSVPVADTGNVETDLVSLLRSSMDLSLTPHGKIFGQFLSETVNDPEFARQFREVFLRPRRIAIGELLDRAVKRGEIDPAFEKEFILDLLFGPLIFRMMVGSGPPSMEAEAIIYSMLCGIGGVTHRSRIAKRPPAKRATKAPGTSKKKI